MNSSRWSVKNRSPRTHYYIVTAFHGGRDHRSYITRRYLWPQVWVLLESGKRISNRVIKSWFLNRCVVNWVSYLTHFLTFILVIAPSYHLWARRRQNYWSIWLDCARSLRHWYRISMMMMPCLQNTWFLWFRCTIDVHLHLDKLIASSEWSRPNRRNIAYAWDHAVDIIHILLVASQILAIEFFFSSWHIPVILLLKFLCLFLPVQCLSVQHLSFHLIILHSSLIIIQTFNLFSKPSPTIELWISSFWRRISSFYFVISCSCSTIRYLLCSYTPFIN